MLCGFDHAWSSWCTMCCLCGQFQWFVVCTCLLLLLAEGSHVLPVMDSDRLAILSQLHDSHVTRRSGAFHELQVSTAGLVLACSSTCSVAY